MAQEGWIKLYRVLTDDDDWNSEPFTIGQAFIDILLRVNHKDGYWKDKHIKRGQMWTSKRKLMERWNVGYTRTQRFLNRMVESEKIFIEYAATGLLITVLNYDKYQSTVATQQQSQEQSQEQSQKRSRKHPQNTNKNDKECIKNEKERRRRADEDEWQ